MSDQLERVARVRRTIAQNIDWTGPDPDNLDYVTALVIAALRPELEDAARYRWLIDAGAIRYRLAEGKEQTDAAIDAARQEGKPT